MRVALFGGSFNPPHVAHQLVALYVLETQPIDELWLVPTFRHRFEKVLAPFDDRLRMCERAAAALGPRVRVDDVEGRLGGESRTLTTVRKLREARPELELSLVIGADLIDEIDSWYGASELRREISFIVVGRQATTVATTAAAAGSGVAMPAVSSTEVRARLAAGQPVDGLVPRGVLDYIGEHKLYGSK